MSNTYIIIIILRFLAEESVLGIHTTNLLRLNLCYTYNHMNNPISRRLAAGLVVTALFTLPVAAFAQSATSTTDVQAQVQALLAQIKALQQQLLTLIQGARQNNSNATTTPGVAGRCPDIKRDLGFGTHGDDVKDLQKFLSNDSDIFPEGSITGFFGDATRRAVKKFQEKFNIASSTGTAGPLTRAFTRGHCGEIESHRGGEGPRAFGILRAFGVTGSSTDFKDDDGDKERGDSDFGDVRSGRIAGAITAAAPSGISIQGPGGTIRQVSITASTTIKKATVSGPVLGGVSDLIVGALVTVSGIASPDGSVTAAGILVGKPFELGHKGGGGPGNTKTGSTTSEDGHGGGGGRD